MKDKSQNLGQLTWLPWWVPKRGVQCIQKEQTAQAKVVILGPHCQERVLHSTRQHWCKKVDSEVLLDVLSMQEVIFFF
jgi:hypothetical protein